jgi:hypothetical protein
MDFQLRGFSASATQPPELTANFLWLMQSEGIEAAHSIEVIFGCMMSPDCRFAKLVCDVCM